MFKEKKGIKKFKEYNQVSIEILFKAMKYSFINAEDYLYEAEILHKMGSYGHSLALSTLGIEELGKSFTFLLMVLNKLGFANDNNLKNLNFNKLYKEIHLSHISKQRLSVAYKLMNDIFIKNIIEVFGANKISIENIGDNINEFAEKVKIKMKNIKKYGKEIDFIFQLQDLKEKGMYVGIDNSGNVNIPKKMKARLSSDAKNFLDNYIEEMYYLRDMKWDVDDKELISLRELMKMHQIN